MQGAPAYYYRHGRIDIPTIIRDSETMEVDCPERVGLKRRGCVGFVSRDNLNSPFGSVLAPRQNSVRKSG